MLPRGFLPASVAVLLLAGCGYHLVRQAETTVSVGAFVNRTNQPRIEQAISDGVRGALITAPEFRVVRAADAADLTISGAVVRFEREPLFRQPAASSRLAMARFFVDIEVSVDGMRQERHLVTETVAVPLADVSDEDEMLRAIGSRAGRRILSVIRALCDAREN